DALRSRDRKVDRLSAGVGESPQARLCELHESLRGVAAHVAKEDRSRPEAATVAEALHEALPLQGADERGGGALRQGGAGRQLADRRRLGGLDDAHEQLRRAVDRLGAGSFGRHLTMWNKCSKRILTRSSLGVNPAGTGTCRPNSRAV